MRVLAVDPGSDKCGMAVLDERDGILARGVVPTRVIAAVAGDWASAHGPTQIVIGGGTSMRRVRVALAELELPLAIFPEANTTLRARRRYFEEHPPRGLWRLGLFRGMLTPPVPVDDYAAVIIGEDFLAAASDRREQEAARREAN